MRASSAPDSAVSCPRVSLPSEAPKAFGAVLCLRWGRQQGKVLPCAFCDAHLCKWQEGKRMDSALSVRWRAQRGLLCWRWGELWQQKLRRDYKKHQRISCSLNVCSGGGRQGKHTGLGRRSSSPEPCAELQHLSHCFFLGFIFSSTLHKEEAVSTMGRTAVLAQSDPRQ